MSSNTKHGSRARPIQYGSFEHESCSSHILFLFLLEEYTSFLSLFSSSSLLRPALYPGLYVRPLYCGSASMYIQPYPEAASNIYSVWIGNFCLLHWCYVPELAHVKTVNLARSGVVSTLYLPRCVANLSVNSSYT